MGSKGVNSTRGTHTPSKHKTHLTYVHTRKKNIFKPQPFANRSKANVKKTQRTNKKTKRCPKKKKAPRTSPTHLVKPVPPPRPAKPQTTLAVYRRGQQTLPTFSLGRELRMAVTECLVDQASLRWRVRVERHEHLLRAV